MKYLDLNEKDSPVISNIRRVSRVLSKGGSRGFFTPKFSPNVPPLLPNDVYKCLKDHKILGGGACLQNPPPLYGKLSQSGYIT